MPSHARVGAAGTQEFVAPGRAVSTDNVDLTAGIVQRRGQVVEEVEQVGIKMTYFSRAMVAEIVVELGQRFWYVIFATPVNDIESFIGMGMVKAKPVFRRGRGLKAATTGPAVRPATA